MSGDKKTKVLFICTGNCCRSQMAEAILRAKGGDRFEGLSAGSMPAGYIHPLAIRALEAKGIPLPPDLRSKSWDEFATVSVDIVITVCSWAAREACPVYPGGPISVHWPLPDPAEFAQFDQSQAESLALFVADQLIERIESLVRLPLDNLSAEEFKAELDRLGDL